VVPGSPLLTLTLSSPRGEKRAPPPADRRYPPPPYQLPYIGFGKMKNFPPKSSYASAPSSRRS